MDSLDGLRTFASVVEAGSFTAAADRLAMSNKLVSKYVAELEMRVGAKLLQRTTRTLRLTSAGQRFYPRAVALLEDFDQMTAEVRAEDRGLSGRLRVSAPTTFGEMYLQDVLADFGTLHPELLIDLRLNDRFVNLTSEGFDLAVRIGALEDSSLIARQLSTTDLIVVASPDYINTHGSPGHPTQLSSHNCIRDSNFRAGQNWPFQINGQARKIAVSGNFMVNSATAVRELVLRGKGIGLCPSYAVARDIAQGSITPLLGGFPTMRLGIQAVFTDQRHMPARTRALLDYLAKAYTDPPWMGL